MNESPQHQRTAVCRHDALNALGSLRLHWPEYLMEPGELGLYMFLACALATLLQHPASPVRHFISSSLARRALYGLAMGSTVIGIVTTPWGKQSGGHFNPAITFTFYRLGKVELWDALFYAVAQFYGATCGVAIAAYVLRGAPANSAVRYAVTVPGVYGNAGAFIGELTISFLLMITILFLTNGKKLARYTPYFVGALYAIYIAFETPLSGMRPRANFRFSISRQPLARDLDLLHSTDVGHVLCGPSLSLHTRGRQLLRQTSPRQQQTLYSPRRTEKSYWYETLNK